MRLCSAAIALFLAMPVTAHAQQFGAGPRLVDWSGGFAGVTAGAVRSTGKASLGAFGGDLITLDVGNGLFPRGIENAEIGAIGGLTLGYNRQSGAVVTSVEIDLSLSGAGVRSDFSRIDPNPNFPFTGLETNTAYETEFGSLATARLRAGYATGASLIYVTGGLAVGRVENRFSLEMPGFPPEFGGPYRSPDWSAKGTRLGYVVGAGVERMVTGRASVKAEVLRFDLRDVTVNGSDPAAFPGESLSYRFDNSGAIVRVGLNFRF